MSSVNPQTMFDSMIKQNPEAKQAMDMINQYGNGDPKTAFMTIMNATGKQALGQEIMRKFGLS